MKYSVYYLVLVLLNFYSCSNTNQQSEYKKISGLTQGTTYNITYDASSKFIEKETIDSLLHQFDLSLNTYIPNSIISRINSNEKNIETDSLFNTVFRTAQRISIISDGFFDITVKPLINIWGFGKEDHPKPNQQQIDSVLNFIGYEKVKLVKNYIVKESPDLMLDVNAIAQGFSVDYLCDYFDKKGIKDYVIEIGGELKTKGVNSRGKVWQIGVDKPVDNNDVTNRQIQSVVSLGNMALATSGNYRKFFEENGVKYAHSLNPKTGYPAKHNLLSATVTSNSCMIADAYATLFMVVGLDKSLELLSKIEDKIEVYFIYSDEKGNYKEFSSNGFSEIKSY